MLSIMGSVGALERLTTSGVIGGWSWVRFPLRKATGSDGFLRLQSGETVLTLSVAVWVTLLAVDERSLSSGELTSSSG